MPYIYLSIAFIFNSLANILIKLRADQGFQWKGLGIMGIISHNIFFFLSLFIFGLNFIFYFLALKNIPISVAYPIMIVMTFLIINSAAHFFLKEQISLLQIFGYGLILMGLTFVFMGIKNNS